MKKICFLCLFLLSCITLSTCNVHNEKQSTKDISTNSIENNNENQNCISPIYNNYYYAIRKQEKDILLPGNDFFQLPPEPWSVVADISGFEVLETEDIEVEDIDLVLVRNIDTGVELWFQDNTFEDESNKYIYIIYSISDGNIKLVKTDFNSLILDQNGRVWGNNNGYFHAVSLYGLPESTLLGLYNDSINDFSIVEDLADIETGINIRDDFFFSTVFFDKSNKLWVYVPGGSLYSYDLHSGEITKNFDELLLLKSVALAPDGNIYFLISTLPKEAHTEDYYYIARFNPNAMEIENIDLQYLLEPYPKYYQTIIVDHTGRLWLDNVAFMNIYDNSYAGWYQIKRDSVFISPSSEYYTDYRYKRADVLLESSDGKIWYRHNNNGMIYLDPDQGTWCWFTTYKSNIIEDLEGNLWMIADGKLYKRPVIE